MLYSQCCTGVIRLPQIRRTRLPHQCDAFGHKLIGMYRRSFLGGIRLHKIKNKYNIYICEHITIICLIISACTKAEILYYNIIIL